MISLIASFVLSFFPRDVLDEILDLTESVSESFPTYSYEVLSKYQCVITYNGLIGKSD